MVCTVSPICAACSTWSDGRRPGRLWTTREIHTETHRFRAYRPTSGLPYGRIMFEVTLLDDAVEVVDGADSFQQEGPLTTFFATGGRHRGLDAWSIKLASFRTDRIAKIVRRAEPAPREFDHEPGLGTASLRTFASTL
jgi:hypothetical protein